MGSRRVCSARVWPAGCSAPSSWRTSRSARTGRRWIFPRRPASASRRKSRTSSPSSRRPVTTGWATCRAAAAGDCEAVRDLAADVAAGGARLSPMASGLKLTRAYAGMAERIHRDTGLAVAPPVRRMAWRRVLERHAAVWMMRALVVTQRAGAAGRRRALRAGQSGARPEWRARGRGRRPPASPRGGSRVKKGSGALFTKSVKSVPTPFPCLFGRGGCGARPKNTTCRTSWPSRCRACRPC